MKLNSKIEGKRSCTKTPRLEARGLASQSRNVSIKTRLYEKPTKKNSAKSIFADFMIMFEYLELSQIGAVFVVDYKVGFVISKSFVWKKSRQI